MQVMLWQLSIIYGRREVSNKAAEKLAFLGKKLASIDAKRRVAKV